jgi:RNA polymerase-binding transcription factor DksA
MSIEDIAQQVEALDWEINNRPRTPRSLFEPDDEEYGPPECVECDIEMPDLRRAMGCELCVACTERTYLRKRLTGA